MDHLASWSCRAWRCRGGRIAESPDFAQDAVHFAANKTIPARMKPSTKALCIIGVAVVVLGASWVARSRQQLLQADIIVRGNTLTCGQRSYRCSVGRSGISAEKREGDGHTPAGRYPLRHVMYRPDRFAEAPRSGLPVRAISPSDGWCDDATHPSYNQPVQLPFPASHEQLWRTDHLYDLIVVIGHNDAPARPGDGSAIFLHIATPDFRSTAGCVAVQAEALIEIVAQLQAGALIDIR
jgi:L,D-peptidoglycan transpeptidase YkuD (ErfK/YbiS/YcfS/YnhG family)